MQVNETDSLIKAMLWRGEKPSSIGTALGIPIYIVYNVKAGRRGHYVEWPNGAIGAMPMVQAATVSKAQGGVGRSVAQQEGYKMISEAAAISERMTADNANPPAIPEIVYAPTIDPRFDEYIEMMRAKLEIYRSNWALKHGYHEEMEELLKSRSNLLCELDTGGKVGLGLFQSFAVDFCRAIDELLGVENE